MFRLKGQSTDLRSHEWNKTPPTMYKYFSGNWLMPCEQVWKGFWLSNGALVFQIYVIFPDFSALLRSGLTASEADIPRVRP